MFFETAAMRRVFRPHRFVGRWLRGGGARRKLLFVLVLLVAAVALLPKIVAKTSLRNLLLSKAVPGGALRVAATDASLSWVAGPSLLGVQITDAAGAPLIAAERISVDRAPGSLILSPHDLGVIEIARPTIHLKVRPDGSNLEDTLSAIVSSLPAKVDKATESAATTPTKFAINIVDATILIDDIGANRQWRIENVNLQYDNRTAKGRFGRAAISGRIVQIAQAAAPAAAGSFSISMQPVDGDRNQLSLQADEISMAMVEPVMRRFMVAIEIGGTLSGLGSATWSNPTAGGPPVDLFTSGTLAIDRLTLTAPQLQGDRINLKRVELPWRVTSQATGCRIEDLKFRCDAGYVAVRGQIDPNLSTGNHSLEMRGSVDVAQLAHMLPHVLQIREGTTIASGAIEIAGEYQPNEDGQIVKGSVRATQFAATNAGRPLRWDQPVSASFAVRRSADELRVDSLKCESQFLQIDASGTWDEFVANASFDLNKLTEQLGQFVEMTGTKLAGTGTAKVAWEQKIDQFAFQANADLLGVAVAFSEERMWSEPTLALEATASGLINPKLRRPSRVDSAKLQVNAEGDVLDAQLTSAVQLTSEAPIWPMTVKATGRIGRWLTRVRPWFAPDPWEVDGQGELSAVVKASTNSVEVTNANLVVTDFRAKSPEWNIVEPLVKLNGDARWNGAASEARANAVQFVSSTVTLAMQDVRYREGDKSISQLTGAAAFRTDLARLAAWRAPAVDPALYRAKGDITGNLRFAQQGDRIAGELNASGQNLALECFASTVTPVNPAIRVDRNSPARGVATSDYQTIWQEPNLIVRGVVSYQPSMDRLAFDQLKIQSNTLQAAASGNVDKLSTAADVNLAGTANYDLALLSPLLRPYIGNGIQLTGREQARFAMTGQLGDEAGVQALLAGATPSDPYRLASTSSATPAKHWSRRVRAQIELPWSGASVYGLPIGPGRLAATIGDGAIRIEPLSLAVGEGTLTAAPHVRFDPEPAEWTLPPGPVITNVRISPEVSEAMLKYVAPVLAGSTQSEGQFSMKLDNTRVPLADSNRADIAGKLSVHSVRVVPGAMAKELISVAQQVEALAKRRDPAALASKPPVTLLDIREQQVNFRVIDGRVHHQNLDFQVGDIALRSQGSVGLDQTLQLTVQIPIQEAWIKKEPLLAGFKGQALQIPVGGTLTRPQMDGRAIASLSQQLFQGAAQQAIGGELNKALDKLFKSR
jgi:hypothetical protein